MLGIVLMKIFYKYDFKSRKCDHGRAPPGREPPPPAKKRRKKFRYIGRLYATLYTHAGPFSPYRGPFFVRMGDFLDMPPLLTKISAGAYGCDVIIRKINL